MNQEWLNIAQHHKKGKRTSVLEDDGDVFLSTGGSNRAIAESCLNTEGLYSLGRSLGSYKAKLIKFS